MPKRTDGCYSRDCKYLTLVFHNGGDPHDWDWGCKKYHVYLRQEKQDVLQCGKCKEEANGGSERQMKNKKIDLKPCPHCAGDKLRVDDSGVYDYGADEKPSSYWVVCLACFAAGGPGGTREEAAENWNRRAP